MFKASTKNKAIDEAATKPEKNLLGRKEEAQQLIFDKEGSGDDAKDLYNYKN